MPPTMNAGWRKRANAKDNLKVFKGKDGRGCHDLLFWIPEDRPRSETRYFFFCRHAAMKAVVWPPCRAAQATMTDCLRCPDVLFSCRETNGRRATPERSAVMLAPATWLEAISLKVLGASARSCIPLPLSFPDASCIDGRQGRDRCVAKGA